MEKLVIKQAEAKDIPEIEKMYYKRVIYNDNHGSHQWDLEEVSWEALSELYDISDYYVGKINDHVVCGMVLVDIDELYWPQEEKGAALYLHKICVDPDYKGLGYSDELIQYFINKAKSLGYPSARIDVRAHKTKLRAMYERNGFKYLKTGKFVEAFDTALYHIDFK